MNFKLIALLILSIVSFQAFAYEGKGFKIISEKVTRSPGFQGGFQETTGKKSIARGYVSALSWAYDASGRVYEYIRIQGDHNVSISNYSKHPQRYTYSYFLKCESAYEQFERTIELAPQGTFADSSHSYGVVQKQSEGSARISVATQIKGAETAWHESTARLHVRK